MPYSSKECDRLAALYGIVESNKEHVYAAPTYKDSPYLKEIAEIVMRHTETDAETMKYSIPVLWYLVDCYDRMCRAGVSVKFYAMLLSCYVRLAIGNKLEGSDEEDFENCFYSLIMARNYYEPDECRDLVEMVTGILPDSKIKELYESARKSRSTLKYDPVEKTERYLVVIDEVERNIELHKTMNFCLEYWNLKEEFLAERGICWRSPVQLNPGVLFD